MLRSWASSVSSLGWLLIAVAGLSACGKSAAEQAPPRANDTITVPPQYSAIAVPITADLTALTAALEREVPRKLWSINKPDQICVASEKLDIVIAKIKTPKIKCRIVGEVTRGKLSISGSGRDLVVTMPLRAVVRAQDIGGILKQESGTANAKARAIIKLDLDSDWNPKASVDISYDWTKEPGIDFLGQRIEFTSEADAKLRPIIARLEKTLPQELRKLNMRVQIENSWRQAFTSLELNHSNPPVWMRITPQELHYGGYQVSGRNLVLKLGLKAQTETFVGERPDDPPTIPLPAVKRLNTKAGRMVFVIPIIADYKQLEPVILKALVKRSARPFDIPGVGAVNAKFTKVVAYGTTGEKVAVGVTFTAEDAEQSLGKSAGTVWLTATPVNPANTRTVSFADISVSGVTDNTGTNLLLKFANAPGLSATIADALTQNFANDYDKLMAKISRAIDEKREGDLVIRARIDNVKTGSLKAAGQGLYLPVYGEGTASVSLAR